MTTNCIKFESADIETSKRIGSISTLTFDINITIEPVASDNPKAPRSALSVARRMVAWSNAAVSGRSRTVTPVLITSP